MYNISRLCSASENVVNLSKFGISGFSDLESIVIVILLVLIIITTLIGNILVILSVIVYKPLRVVQNFFIVSLAVADLTVAIFVLPINLVYSILGGWVLGTIICKIWLTLDIMCCTASILNLCAIAIDRYQATNNPITYARQRTINRVLVMTAIVWTVSFLISSPPLLGWNDWPEKFDAETPCRLTYKPVYVVFSSLASFFIPLSVMSFLYYRIYIVTKKMLRRRVKAIKNSIMSRVRTEDNTQTDTPMIREGNPNKNKNISRYTVINEKNVTLNRKRRASKIMVTDNIENQNAPSMSNSNETNLDDIEAVGSTGQELNQQSVVPEFIEKKQRIYLHRERKAARVFGFIMGAFAVSWCPFFIIYLGIALCPNCCISMRLINAVTWLGYANSSINPFIYTILNKDFRKAFKNILLCRFSNL